MRWSHFSKHTEERSIDPTFWTKPSRKLYTGLLKIGNRMCNEFWWNSQFFGKVLFVENAKFPIFWKSPVLPKEKFLIFFWKISRHAYLKSSFFKKDQINENGKKRLLKKFAPTCKKMGFAPRFWMKFFQRKNWNFSTRKSDQKGFSATELENFRLTVDRKMMFYPVHTILNTDETGVNYLETRGRIICESGKK